MGWFKSTEPRRTLYVQVTAKELSYTFGMFSTNEHDGYVKGRANVKFNLHGTDYDFPIYLFAHIGNFDGYDKSDAFRRMLRTDRSVIVEALKKDVAKGINNYFKENKEKSLEEMLENQTPFSISFDMSIDESEIEK